MPEFKIFTEATVPDGYAHQRRAFARIHWYDIYSEYPDAPIKQPDDPHTRYFMMVQQDALLSSASSVRREIEADGVPYVCYGMSGVMTFPAFRKRGYGRQLVDAASNHMRQQPDADVALLWTSPDLGVWYEKSGWEIMHGLTLYVGERDNPRHDDDSFLMMMFISERAKANRETFLASRIYIGQHTW